jgi:hypothetical protein
LRVETGRQVNVEVASLAEGLGIDAPIGAVIVCEIEDRAVEAIIQLFQADPGTGS